MLLEEEADIYAYDPVGIDNFKKIFSEGITYTDSLEEALKNADVAFIFTEWEQIVNIKPDTFKRLMKTPVIYDGRNCYNVDEFKNAGIEYYSIGR